MEQLLNKRTVQMPKRMLNAHEECPISGEYVLPEYLSDIAAILKCFAYPRMQSRQWSGDQLLIDGMTVIRVLYMDEERKCIRSLEFAQPFACSIRGTMNIDNAVEIRMTTKYINCRAVSPRRVEVRGAVEVSAQAECAVPLDVAVPQEREGFYALTEKVSVSVPRAMVDKVMTVNESLEFDRSLPPAEMLLGGDCCAVIKECKLLTGKAIVKGNVYIHQLYTDTTEGTQTHCLDFVIPFSQILDVSDASEGVPYKASVQVLSDTERCAVGPDGENTVLEITTKLLIQLQIYKSEEVEWLNDAYHCHYPVTVRTEEREWMSLLSHRFEEMKLPLRLTVPLNRWQEIIDIWALTADSDCSCGEGSAVLNGRLQIIVIARDADGEIVCHESFEDYTAEYACRGNAAEICPTVTEIRYRALEDALNLEVSLCVDICDCRRERRQLVTDIHVCEETPYPTQKVSALLYYGEEGETIWDIARACHTSPQSVLSENELNETTLRESQVLVVPIAY